MKPQENNLPRNSRFLHFSSSEANWTIVRNKSQFFAVWIKRNAMHPTSKAMSVFFHELPERHFAPPGGRTRLFLNFAQVGRKNTTFEVRRSSSWNNLDNEYTGEGVYNTNHFSEWLVLFRECSSDWCYKSQIRKNDFLQKSENLS